MDITNITLHKPLPIRKAVLFVGQPGESNIDKLMSDSNITPEPVLRPDGYGGQRMIAVRWKVTLYINRFDVLVFGSVLNAGQYANNGRFPIKLLLGGTGTNVVNAGEQWLNFTNTVHYLTFHHYQQTADKFLKTAMIWSGVLAPNANIWV